MFEIETNDMLILGETKLSATAGRLVITGIASYIDIIYYIYSFIQGCTMHCTTCKLLHL